MELPALEEIESYRELLNERAELGDDADSEINEEIQEGVRFDGIVLKGITDKIAKKLGKDRLTRSSVVTLEGLPELTTLSFANCKLVSLDNLPKLPKLDLVFKSDCRSTSLTTV
jgi:Leucine-rich repeat (LRR) protein